MSRIITSLAAILLGTSVAAAQSPPARTLQRVDSMAAAEFAKDSIGSLTIGVVTPEGLVWTRSYGFADMSTHRLANRQSVYRIGSITKMFTGLMLQQLVAVGKIHLTDPVERYYPGLDAPPRAAAYEHGPCSRHEIPLLEYRIRHSRCDVRQGRRRAVHPVGEAAHPRAARHASHGVRDRSFDRARPVIPGTAKRNEGSRSSRQRSFVRRACRRRSGIQNPGRFT